MKKTEKNCRATKKAVTRETGNSLEFCWKKDQRPAMPSHSWMSGENFTITGVNTTATMLMSFTRMFREGPEVSLQGSPTVSPITAAAWVGFLLPSASFLPPKLPFSICFLALSQAPPALLSVQASANPAIKDLSFLEKYKIRCIVLIQRWEGDETMKDLTSGLYCFEDLIRGNFLYVDKTEYIWQLIRPAKGLYFLSRPRRFGKSLTLSTLKAVFQGKKELFKGLAIYDKPYDWKTHPVIHLDMNGRDFGTVENMTQSFRQILKEQAAINGVVLPETTANTMFHSLIQTLHDRDGDVVILLDEYDKPILNNLSKENASDFLAALKVFYSVIKEKSGMLRLAFITGVSKFCHVSLFSDLNNLTDITMDARFATMLGYTQAEFEANFKERIDAAEKKQSLSHEDFLAEVKNWYDGFRFHADCESVYNPVSLAKFFEHGGEFSNYWFQTGTSSFLFAVMKKQSFNLPEALETTVSSSFFDAFEIDRLNPKTLLHQTGYLTIGKAVKVPVPFTKVMNTEYTLVFPNYEVKSSFNDHLLNYYTNVQTDQSQRLVRNLIQDIGSGNADGFMKQLQVLFANIPYDMRGKQEHDYQTVIYVIFMMLNIFIEGEHRTGEGRIDLMLGAGEWIYVIELKLNETAEAAMQQIHDKNYALKFRNRGKKIMLIGANLDSGKGQLTDWIKEEYHD